MANAVVAEPSCDLTKYRSRMECIVARSAAVEGKKVIIGSARGVFEDGGLRNRRAKRSSTHFTSHSAPIALSGVVACHLSISTRCVSGTPSGSHWHQRRCMEGGDNLQDRRSRYVRGRVGRSSLPKCRKMSKLLSARKRMGHLPLSRPRRQRIERFSALSTNVWCNFAVINASAADTL